MAPSRIRLLATLFLVVLGNHARGEAPCLIAQQRPGAAAFREDERFLYAGNERIEFIFQKSDGKLYSVQDKASSQEFLREKNAYWGPFNFLVTVDGESRYIPGNSARRFSYESVRGADKVSVRFVWDQFWANRLKLLNVRVQITIEIPDSGSLTYWRISINNNEDLAIRQVSFPDFEGIGRLGRDGDDDYLVYPIMSGVLIQNPLKNFATGTGWGWQMYYPSSLASMQFLALYSRESRSGLYLAAYDPDGHSKYLSAGKPVEDWYSVQAIHIPPTLPQTDFLPSYTMAVGVFSGDWYDAAQIYRDWAMEQSWSKSASLRRTDGAPGWYKELALHLWYRSGDLSNCANDPYSTQGNPFSNLPITSRDVAGVVGAPVAIDWTGWERNAWYIDYPKVFPPKEGWPSFDKTIADTHKLGNYIWVVPSTNSFSSRLEDWAHAKSFTVIDESGGYPYSWSYSECGLETRFFIMCPATQYWQDELHTMLTQLVSHGVDIIQLDGFPVVAPPCYALDHDHPPGGGDWHFQAYRTLFERIRNEARLINPQIAFSAEGMAEAYLGLLDSVWDPFTSGWVPPAGFELIPLWHAVYHDSTLIQSGLTLIDGRPEGSAERDYYIRGLARALIWGEAPSIVVGGYLPNLHAPDEEAMKQYLKEIVQARRTYGAPFLVVGRMLRPPVLDVPDIQLPAAATIPYTAADYPPSRSPSVLGSLWKAPSGDMAYVLTNISHDRVDFNLELDPAEMELPLTGSYEIYQIRNGDYSLVAETATLPQTLPIQADPLDVIVIGIRTASPGAASGARIARIGAVSAPGLPE